jgi:hypothetical protein
MASRFLFRMTLTCSQAIDILVALGCDEDPVFCEGIEYTVREMWEIAVSLTRDAGKEKIKFYDRRGLLVDGSLTEMVADRLELEVRSRPKQKVVKLVKSIR